MLDIKRCWKRDARKSGGNIRARKEEEEDNADDGEGKKLEQRRL